MRALLICIALAGITLAVYWPVRSYDFVSLDDFINVRDNPLVTGGLRPSGLQWACTTSHPDYWRPLVWISYMVEYELHRGRAGGYHITNVLLHVAGSLVLLGALHSMTRALWRSAFVAAIFALHPLHVESVAWITERKDVLSALLGFMAIWLYAKYALPGSRRAWLWYAASLGAFALGLMAKPMLVTLPFVLLLLDYWPLRRINVRPLASAAHQPNNQQMREPWWKLIVEKLPFLLLSAGSCIMTMRGGSRSIVDVPLQERLGNTAVSYVRYIGKLFWPDDLAVQYPYPGRDGAEPWSAFQVAGSAAIVAVVTLAAIVLARRAGYLLVGWLWYLGMLVPVIGLLQVGGQSMADRFVHMPMVGLLIMIAWGVGDGAARLRVPRVIPATAAAIAIAGCIWATSRQLPHWRNSDALYQRTLSVTDDNWFAHEAYANQLAMDGRYDESIRQFENALRLKPDDARTHARLGEVLTKAGRYFDAKERLEQAIKLDPGNAGPHVWLGIALSMRDEHDLAAWHLREAMRLAPEKRAEYQAIFDSIQRAAPPTSPHSPTLR